jgi:hypothetical protein
VQGIHRDEGLNRGWSLAIFAEYDWLLGHLVAVIGKHFSELLHKCFTNQPGFWISLFFAFTLPPLRFIDSDRVLPPSREGKRRGSG